MNPKHKLVTLSWCVVTMIITMLLSHGHLIMKEILAQWPKSESWEGRLESALYTQGGMAVLASLLLSTAILVRGYFAKRSSDQQTRRELALRERHERAAASRHEALLESLTAITGTHEEAKSSEPLKKFVGSGTKAK